MVPTEFKITIHHFKCNVDAVAVTNTYAKYVSIAVHVTIGNPHADIFTNSESFADTDSILALCDNVG